MLFEEREKLVKGKENALREVRAIKNIVTNMLLQLVLMMSGLMIPQLILRYYGSTVNGMLSSVSQFISYAALAAMGIEDAAAVELYKPITERNRGNICAVLTETNKMYTRSGKIYFLAMVMLAFIYPLFLRGQIPYRFAFIMVLCIGCVNVVDFFVLGKYRAFLLAEQKVYILNAARILTTVLLIVGSVLFLKNNISIFLVKLLIVITHMLEALLVKLYIRIRYSWLSCKSDIPYRIKQRWNALVHQVCGFIVYNTDLVILTIFLTGNSLVEVSVYAVYALVFSMLTNFVNVMTTGMPAFFGSFIAGGEQEKMKHYFGMYELIFLMFSCFMCVCFGVLIIPFVSCYIQGVSDADYIKYEVGILFALCGASAQIKDAASVVIRAAGKYKETQRYAIEEAIVNIVISLLLVRTAGIVGVLIGTLISHVLMSYRIMCYMARNILTETGKCTLRRVLRYIIILGTFIAVELPVIRLSTGWSDWILQAIVVALGNAVLIVGINYCFEASLMKEAVKMARQMLLGREKVH